MADQHHIATLARVVPYFHVYLGDERTGGVEHLEVAALRFVLDRLRDTVRREDDRRAVRHFVEFLHEHRAHAAQPLDDMTVVDHLVAHEDRRAVELDRTLDDVDGAVDSGTEATRVGEAQLQGAPCPLPSRDAARPRRQSRKASSSISPAPTEIAMSAMLKAGKYAPPQCAWMKSTT